MKTNILKKIAAITSALALLVSLVNTQTVNAGFSGATGRTAAASSRDGNNEIYSFKSDGSDPRRLTNNPASEITPRYSPDGRKIVFVSERDGNREIYTMNADGSNQVRITNNSVVDQQPTWSPDGTRIAFNSQLGGSQDIWVVNSDGTGLVQVTNTAGQTEQSPDWSPDGTKILYRGNEAIFGYRYYTVHPDGSNMVAFTNTSTVDNTTPRWSPDGSKIIFNTTRDGNNEIYSMDADGSNVLNLTNDASSDTNPQWTPEGEILFYSNRGGTVLGYIMNADGSSATVTALTDIAVDIQPLTIPPATTDLSLTLDATKGSVTYNAPDNHTDAYEEIDPTSVEITTQPQHGTVVINETTGEITYTPKQHAQTGQSILASLDNLLFQSSSAQAANQDSFSYQICSTVNSELCTTNTVQVNLAVATTGSLASTGSSSQALAIYSGMLVVLGLVVTAVRKKYHA